MKIRLVFWAVLAALYASPSLADDERICRDRDTGYEDRVAACERLLETTGDQATALVWLGEAHRDNEAPELAIAAYSRALEINPDHPRAYSRRSVALDALDRWDEAIADLQRLTELEPEHHWAFYRLGWALNETANHTAALEQLLRSVELNPDYYHGWYELSRSYRRLNRAAEAAAAYRQANRIRPFSAQRHQSTYFWYERAAGYQEAAYHARIALTLDPNLLHIRDWLDGYVSDQLPPVLDPMEWSPPPEGREIRYFMVHAPVDTRDEMEIAIEDLFSFFGGSRRPLPNSAAVLRMSQRLVEPDWVLPEITFEHRQEGSLNAPFVLPRYRGMFRLQVAPLGPGRPTVEPRFDGTSPADIWPLADGNATAGHGRFVVDCPDEPSLSSALMGCLPGVDEADVGTFDWQAAISTDRIHVPMGLFDTYRVDISMSGSVTLLGRTRELPYTASYWIEPGLNTWVAEIFTVGDNYAYNQAMEIVQGTDSPDQ